MKPNWRADLNHLIQTQRLKLREMDADRDAAFTLELLNSPKFIKYIGDRSVRTEAEAADFIETRYRQSYRDNGFGLYAVELRSNATPIGICGFVKRDTLPLPDIGFAFLPDFEGKGYGFEAASATLDFGRETLGMTRVLAIVTPTNVASVGLLKKLGFELNSSIDPGVENVDVYDLELTSK